MSKKFKLPHHDLLRTLIKTNNRKIWMKNGQYWLKKLANIQVENLI